MRRHFAIAASCILTAVLVATFASADSVGIGIKKTAPLSGTGSSGSPLKLDVCLNGSAYVSNGTSWGCAVAASGDITGVTVTSPACSAGSFMATLTGGASSGDAPVGGTCVAEVGDVSSVVAGNGLITGGTSGAVTLDVACTTGLTCNANDVSLNLSGASCSAGSFVSAISATGTGTCTASPTNFITAVTSDFSVTGTTLDLSTAVTAPGTLATAGNLTAGDAAGDVFDSNGSLSKFGGASDGYVYIAELSLGYGYAVDADLTGYISNTGYANGSTRFRNLEIHDGKAAAIATFTGSTKAVALAGALNVTGLVTATAGVTTPANLTTTGTGDLVVADTGSIGTTLVVGSNITGGGYAEIANAVYANSQSVYTSSGGINAFRTTNAAATLLINPVGYLDSTTQFRDACILDGKGNNIYCLDASEAHGIHYGTAPTLTGAGCIAACTIASYSTDEAGKVSCTDVPAGGCTIDYANDFTTNPPSCTFSVTGSGRTVYETSAPTVSVATFTTTGAASAHSIDYHCKGML